MSEPIATPPSGGESPAIEEGEPLQFDQAEFAAPPSELPTCTVCKQPIPEEYYEINGKVMCPRCRHGVEATFRGGSPVARFCLALIYGGAAAMAGAIVYYVSIRLTHANWGLVSILVGFLVGKAVRHGSGNRGGSFYQLLAVVLSYASLVSVYVLSEIQDVSLRAWIEHTIQLFPSPLKEGIENPLRGLIYAFALWEAWKINVPVQLVFNGPFRLGAAGAADLKPEGVDDGA